MSLLFDACGAASHAVMVLADLHVDHENYAGIFGFPKKKFQWAVLR